MKNLPTCTFKCRWKFLHHLPHREPSSKNRRHLPHREPSSQNREQSSVLNHPLVTPELTFGHRILRSQSVAINCKDNVEQHTYCKQTHCCHPRGQNNIECITLEAPSSMGPRKSLLTEKDRKQKSPPSAKIKPEKSWQEAAATMMLFRQQPKFDHAVALAYFSAFFAFSHDRFSTAACSSRGSASFSPSLSMTAVTL